MMVKPLIQTFQLYDYNACCEYIEQKYNIDLSDVLGNREKQENHKFPHLPNCSYDEIEAYNQRWTEAVYLYPVESFHYETSESSPIIYLSNYLNSGKKWFDDVLRLFFDEFAIDGEVPLFYER